MPVARSAQQILRRALGPQARFRDDQLEAIVALAERRERVLVVQRTGWGKSIVYFVATRLRRDAGAGPTILISPLLSLMRDQVRMAEELGVRAATLNNTNKDEWDAIEERLAADTVDLLLVSPERLANERFRNTTLPSIRRGIGLFVVDEAHCVSDWGHDFRPNYRRIRRITAALPPGVPLLATTATANDRVVADIEEQLGPDLVVFRGPLARESLRLQVVSLDDQAERLAWLVGYLRTAAGSGIVYALTIADAERVSQWLKANGIDAPAYHGGLADDERRKLEARLRENDVQALVATVALGMGFDKPDLAFVLHFQRPGSAITYYQEIGRAGRALESADVVLLTGREDDDIARYFIDSAFPPEQTLRNVLRVVEAGDSVGRDQLEQQVNAKRGEIDRAIALLEVDGAIARDGGRWARTVNAWAPDAKRIECVGRARRSELDRMRVFVTTDDCLMRFLTQELDDVGDRHCGRCANCAGSFAATTVSSESLLREAHRFLRRSHRPIEPRKQWAAGVQAGPRTIPVLHQLREGRVLASYGDAGFGGLVRRGKYDDRRFGDELVEAVAEMIERDLRPDPAPTWVTAVPSRHDPVLVGDFATRLAGRLGLPYRSALVKVRDTSPQKHMANGPHQAANAYGAFAVDAEHVLPGPVVLVDDLVDSGWTLTVCGVALAEAGSGPVFPVALGRTAPGSD